MHTQHMINLQIYKEDANALLECIQQAIPEAARLVEADPADEHAKDQYTRLLMLKAYISIQVSKPSAMHRRKLDCPPPLDL